MLDYLPILHVAVAIKLFSVVMLATFHIN
uniref:Uncharacterized protein n=1 Tax=Anguilla anguilla TaxID=7936 RepID=A0A0E9UL25_ANGAN